MQDNFKLTPTLDAGIRSALRVERNAGGGRESLHRSSILRTVTLTQVGTNGLGANAAYNQNYNFEPRLGFAWDVFGTGKTVVRGGYAYLVDQPVSGVVTGLASNPPFSTAVSYNGTAIPVSSLYASAKASGISTRHRQPQLQECVHRELQPERAAGAALGHGRLDLLRTGRWDAIC